MCDLDGNGWVAIGVGDNGMTNADMVICSGASSLSVQRYWSTGQAPPSNGDAVAGATCTQSGGKTVMTFTRNIASSGSTFNTHFSDLEIT